MLPRLVSCISLAFITLGPFLVAAADRPTPAQIQFFESKIRPLLVERCFDCHSADAQESGLRLDSLQAMLDGGERGPAIVRGDAKNSLLMHAVNHSEADLQMPEGDKLTAAAIRDLAQWIDDGAVWPGHSDALRAAETTGGAPLFTDEDRQYWAFVRPKRGVPPRVLTDAWVQSELDRYVLAQLEAANLLPAPPASRPSLIRRVYFDLIGLPPTPAQVRRFLDNGSPQAFEQLVDELLASPQYGERWGRHWLDVARYADSNGLDENVAFEFIYKYRDWVIEAFNRDLPYNDFVMHQLAGDLLPQQPAESADAYIQRVTAAGFLSVGPKMVADDDPMKKKMDVIDEQLNTLSQAFMALTVGCARCHDHKFDPIPTWDYYAMAGILKSTKTLEHLRVVAPIGLHQLKPQGYDERLAAYEDRHRELTARQAEMLRQAAAPQLAVAHQHIGDYLRGAEHYGAFYLPNPETDIVWEAEDAMAGALDTKQLGDTTVIHGRANPTYEIALPTSGRFDLYLRFAAAKAQAIKVFLDGELLNQQGGYFATGKDGEANLRWYRHAQVTLLAGTHQIRIERAHVYVDQLAIAPARGAVDDPVVPPAQLAQNLGVDATLLEQWCSYQFQLEHHDFGVFSALVGAGDDRDERFETLAGQFQAATAQPTEASLAAHRAILTDDAGPFRIPKDADRWISAANRAEWNALQASLAALASTKPALETIMAPTDDTPEDLRVSLRGNYLTLGEPTRRQFLRIIEGETPRPIETSQSGRLELARWLTSDAHPLTARVIVNRIWRWRFGRGIVSTPDNFGRLGDRPTHPDLLDWLAVTFMTDDNWSLKKLHKRMLLSATYQMSSRYDAVAYASDPENRLLWRFPRKRLEAEAVRDSILYVSDGLSLEMGGSLLPIKDREYVTGTASKTQEYDNPRRSVYQPVYRSAVYDVLTAFDFPDPATLNGDRQNSVVAPQALLMMNSALVGTHARRLAEQLLRNFEADEPRIAWLFEQAISRPPTAGEREAIVNYVKQARESHDDHDGETDLGIWEGVCRVLLSSNEFLYID